MTTSFGTKTKLPASAGRPVLSIVDGCAPVLSIRHNPSNQDHHLFNNHGTWWLHCTLHLPDSTKHRLRQSLRTRDRTQARTRRDALFQSLHRH